MTGKTILLVEDEAILCMDQAEKLKKNGYNVITAGNGQAAIKWFDNENKIDLILMDIDLGKGMDGTETAQIILKKHPVPLIFLSSHTETDYITKAEKITSYGYVVKNTGDNVLFLSIKMAFKLYQAYQENEEKAKSLNDSELRYRRLFESARDGIFILDADSGKIIDVNPYLMDLIGFDYDELTGRHLWEISPFHDISENKAKFSELQKQGYVHYENLPLLHRNGLIKHVEFVSNVYTVNKRKIIQCNIRDIEKRKQMEDAKEILLAGKVTMLRELQHRIKNSLFIISGLINIESDRLQDPVSKEVLHKIRDRIDSISHLYGLLNCSENTDAIQLDQYIANILELLLESYSTIKRKILLKLSLDKIFVGMDIALPTGLIVTELATNILKYAFPEESNGIIQVILTRKAKKISLEISDNGIGILTEKMIHTHKGIGMQIVHMLTKQINGTFKILKLKKGTLCRIQFQLS